MPDGFLSPVSAHQTRSPEGMRTIPCTALDLTAALVVFTTGLVIDTRLDTSKLQGSLFELVEHKFPRAGARLALRNGAYEFVIPHIFDANNPPVAFTSEDFPEPYRSSGRPELPIHLSDAFDSATPSIHPLPPALDEYLWSRECPTSLDGFLVPNTPVIHVRVTTFQDLTFIGLTASHITLDAVGVRTLLHAWTLLLSGEPIDSIQGMEWDAQPFKVFMGSAAATTQTLGGVPEPGLVVEHSCVPKVTTFIVRVPKAFLDDSSREINQSLQLRGSGEWVGSSDVLLAWWFKTTYSYRTIDDETSIHIHIPTDLRGMCIFPGPSALEDHDPYIHNATSLISVPPIPANGFHTESLAELALRIRRSVTASQEDLDGITAQLRMACANPSIPRFPNAPGSEHSLQSNWRKARFRELDFSGACKRTAHVVLVLGPIPSTPAPGLGIICMEDDHALWMCQTRTRTHWDNIRRSGIVAFI
ncbi:hypothetical protein B0H17DRAFT_1227528 [Mycena rosella]|uniref:Uncharacterized protein n=1 Tax=Mycena rosella TaxID=1033263 RepID=A0AAD7D8D8_MYCRO|nr:hypothetical protein B0H17DRAFT_1227528 [Mycena rosella]